MSASMKANAEGLAKLAHRLRSYARNGTQMDKDMLAAAQAIQFDIEGAPTTEPLASITTDPRFTELAGAVAAAVEGSSVQAAITLLAQHVDGQLGRQHQAIQTLMRLNMHLAEMAASAAPRLIGIDWSTDYLTEQRAAMRDAAAQLAEGYGPSRPIANPAPAGRRIGPAESKIIGRWEGEQAASSNIAAAIRQLDPRPVLTQDSIDRAKGALEDFAGAVWNQPNSASQVSPAMGMPSRTLEQHQQAAHNPGIEGIPNAAGIRAMCSCGWKGQVRTPLTHTGQYDAARDEAARHLHDVRQEQRQ